MPLAPSSFRALTFEAPMPVQLPESGFFLAAQNVPPAPGREHPATEGAPAPAPTGGPPPDGGALGGLLPLLIMVVPMLLLLFFTSRSQQKKQAAVMASLKKGDRVLTQSGLVGRLVSIEGRYAELQLPPSGTKVTILRSGLLGRDAEGESTAGAADADKDKDSRAKTSKTTD